MTFLTDMSKEVDRLGGALMRRVLEAQEAEIHSILEEAMISGAMRGDATVVMVYKAGEFPRLRARLA